MIPAEVDRPQWCEPSRDRRGGRYILSVEAPVMSLVDTLTTGMSSLTRLVRTHTVKTLLRRGPATGLAELGRSSYSPYSWSSGRSTTTQP